MITRKTDRKRAEITPDTRRYILTQTLSSTLSRELLADQLSEKVEDKNGNHPRVDTLKKMISEIRNTTSPLDKIWNFGALLNPDYQLNPAVVPILIKEQSRRKTNNEHPLTIGESLWASKLCSTLFDLLKDNPKVIPESVIWWASEYALKEKLDKFAGTKEFDTSDFDAELVQHPDMSYETYLKDIKKGGRNPFLIPDRVPSHFGIGILFPLPTNIDLAKRDKIRKARQKKREKEGDYDLDKKLHFEKDGE